MTNMLQKNEAARLQALLDYQILDTEPEVAFDELTHLAAYICKTPVALISLLDTNRQWFKSKIGLNVNQTPRDIAFCNHAIVQPNVLIVTDALQDERFATNPLVTSPPHIRFYAGVPLITPEGYALGTLCVIDFKPREIKEQQLVALRMLGRQVMAQLELKRKLSDLAYCNSDRQQVRKQIIEQNTAQKKLESQLFRSQRLESIGILASGIAHDLNNILTPILMTAQLLQTQIQDERSRHLLSIQVNNVKRGANLVKQVLSFARGIEGKRTNVQVRHIILEIKQILTETFPKSIEVCTDISSELWTVFGDPTQLHQVLMNLCVNARDAMADGGILTISAENLVIDEHYAKMNLDAQEGCYIVITVSDTGTGIPPEIINRIFEPFFTTKEVGKGTGLGLSTVIGIIKGYSGFVNVYSEVERGTRFKVYLKADEQKEPQQAQQLQLIAGNGELVLVVDDEVAIRDTIKSTLEAYNYQVLTASDGIEALAIYAQYQQKINLVLLDIMMPSMDGMTTIRMLNKMNPHCKIIAMSGLESNAKIAQAINHGVKAFLSKPCTAKELLQTINELNSRNESQ
ncbi:GAF domain-containing hybrid sensor histidine kinase/response regulator [Iningainema tapete]|uniref:histidine kinase n=1 Tax=Iningainema tapete BLCC-T55 TaxID=2748662 RepID=A0A8J6XIC8_9CYAN|nr:response regulator [Iningainema tapete]MBD2773815.1 response regulator [Iningainema tapete BLCC-T55]